ncbi:MAG: VTT domain-containing protein [Magnetospiraceae bacterium]
MTDTPPKIFTPDTHWRTAQCDALRFIVDAADYFSILRSALLQARQSVLIIGWDINSQVLLSRDPVPDDLPVELGPFLDALAHRSPDLTIHLLNWDFPLLYQLDREFMPVSKFERETHERVIFRLDGHFPSGSSHHQKIVVIDDVIAFTGGLDITIGRWDTPEHRPGDERRIDCASQSEIPRPHHDVQALVSGEIAAALGDLARDRWRIATGDALSAPTLEIETAAAWPQDVPIDIKDLPVAISRTAPSHGDQTEVREIEALLIAAIGSASDAIYIENQYLAAPSIGKALARKLADPEGPEVVIVLPFETDGWLSRKTMDVLRERLIRHLYAVDHGDRLRVLFPHMPGLKHHCINVHSKLLIIDDAFLTLGSANFNNRSMGLDTECNISFASDGLADRKAAILELRHRLLAEHLNVEQAAVEKAVATTGSLIEAVDRLRGRGRSLRTLGFRVPREEDATIPDADIIDPVSPLDGPFFADQLVEREERSNTWRTLGLLTATVSSGLVIAATWRWTPLHDLIDLPTHLKGAAHLGESWLAPLIVAGLFILGGLVAFPITLLFLATGAAFGMPWGFYYGLLGALLSAAVTYGIGKGIARDTVQRYSHKWIGRVSRRLARQGVFAVITLRLVPVAPFTVINIVAGASHIRFREFMLGSALGLLPGALGLSFVSDLAAEAVRTPALATAATLVGVAIAVGIGLWAVARWACRR